MPRADAGPDLVFYDGACGLCHASVRFALRHDADGSRLRFAPLGGAAWRAAAAGEAPPSGTVVVVAADGRTFVRSAAVARLLERLGGGWAALAALLGAVPAPLRDAAYDVVARLRRRLRPPPADACPTPAPRLRARLDLRP